MAVFKCKMCGGALEVSEGMTVCECEYCGTQQTLPKTDNEQNLNMFNRANHFRQQCEFDKAAEIYEKMAARSDGDAELYWSIVLCRYGIEYVDDPLTKKKIATCHRTQFKSILNDPDYLSALEHADTIQRSVYEREAAYIDKVQKGILEISNKEQPFDVFICYKETDENGRRTPDSVLAQELYYGLTQEGFKVFFSRITLESKLGTEYEPYIFAALNSAKAMVVVGTKPEYFNAVWVRNEWSRYLMLMQEDRSRTLIPAYKDMDPYDLPDALSMFQAQDMSKLGFMQDLIRGIKKIVQKEPEQPVVKTVIQQAAPASANIENLLKRGNLALEDGKWDEANRFFEQVLDEDVEEPRAYIGKLCAEMKVQNEASLLRVEQDFTQSDHFRKACRFGGDAVKKRLTGYRMQGQYDRALQILNNANDEQQCENARKLLMELGDFSDSAQKAEECRQKAIQIRYDSAVRMMNKVTESELESAAKMFSDIPDYKDAAELHRQCRDKIEALQAARKAEQERQEQERQEQERIEEERNQKRKKKLIALISGIAAVLVIAAIITVPMIVKASRYNKAVEMYENGQYSDAKAAFEELGDYKDAPSKVKEILLELLKEANDNPTVSADNYHTVGLESDGTVVAAGDNYSGQCDVSGWRDIVAVSAGQYHTVGLKSDGTVVAAGDNHDGRCDVSGWKDIVAVSAGQYHTVGLKSDGTVVAAGLNRDGQCDVSGWKDIVAVSAGAAHTVGLKSDGTVVAVGNNKYGQCDVSGWKDIVAVSAGGYYTIGLKSDGTVVAAGYNGNGQCNVSDWKDIVAVSAGHKNTVGLKSDGTVVATGENGYGQCDVSGWKDIVAVSAGVTHTVGLKSDGTVVAAGNNGDGQCDVSGWTDIKTEPRS